MWRAQRDVSVGDAVPSENRTSCASGVSVDDTQQNGYHGSNGRNTADNHLITTNNDNKISRLHKLTHFRFLSQSANFDLPKNKSNNVSPPLHTF